MKIRFLPTVKDHMARSLLFVGLGTLALAAGCDHSERITRLEKQTKELQEKHTVAEYDLREKCSRDAKAWFNENWSRDKDTVLLSYTNHYSKAMNKCFIVVEYHFRFGGSGSWTNDMTLWDVQENSQHGNFNEYHESSANAGLTKTLVACYVQGKECKTVQEFNNLVRPYMND